MLRYLKGFETFKCKKLTSKLKQITGEMLMYIFKVHFVNIQDTYNKL